MNTMHSPYGFEPVEKCDTCPLRGAGFFCDLSRAALKALEAVKYTTAYPQGAVLFVEQEDPRGVFVCAGDASNCRSLRARARRSLPGLPRREKCWA